jgi:hypothetical protein
MVFTQSNAKTSSPNTSAKQACDACGSDFPHWRSHLVCNSAAAKRHLEDASNRRTLPSASPWRLEVMTRTATLRDQRRIARCRYRNMTCGASRSRRAAIHAVSLPICAARPFVRLRELASKQHSRVAAWIACYEAGAQRGRGNAPLNSSSRDARRDWGQVQVGRARRAVPRGAFPRDALGVVECHRCPSGACPS